MKNKVAFIAAQWHSDIVDSAKDSFHAEMVGAGYAAENIESFKVPGSLEIPLQSKLLIETGKYDIIVAAGFIVNGGIYRHEFVAASVLDAMVRLQLEKNTPIISMVLTPIDFDEKDPKSVKYFVDHMVLKGQEGARATLGMISNLADLEKATT